MASRYSVIDNRTGEVIDGINGLFPEPMNEDGYRVPPHKRGFRLFTVRELPDQLSWSDKGRLVSLAVVMVGDSAMLGYRKGDKILPYTSEELSRRAGFQSRSKGLAWLACMMKLNMMRKVRLNTGEIQYYLNPAYFLPNGKRLSLNLYLLWQDELKDMLPEWAKKDFLSQANNLPAPYDVMDEVEETIYRMKLDSGDTG